MIEQLEVQTAVTRMLHAIDALDWPAFQAAFLPRIDMDYTSLFPGQPETLTIDTLLGRWVPLAHGYDATHHQIGPVVLLETDGRSARAEAHVRASHYIANAEGGPIWVAVGHYVWRLERQSEAWKIGGMTFQLAHQEGNTGLPALAVARGQAGQGRPRR